MRPRRYHKGLRIRPLAHTIWMVAGYTNPLKIKIYSDTCEKTARAVLRDLEKAR